MECNFGEFLILSPKAVEKSIPTAFEKIEFEAN